MAFCNILWYSATFFGILQCFVVFCNILYKCLVHCPTDIANKCISGAICRSHSRSPVRVLSLLQIVDLENNLSHRLVENIWKFLASGQILQQFVLCICSDRFCQKTGPICLCTNMFCAKIMLGGKFQNFAVKPILYKMQAFWDFFCKICHFMSIHLSSALSAKDVVVHHWERWESRQSVRLWLKCEMLWNTQWNVKWKIVNCEMLSRRALGNPFQLSRNVRRLPCNSPHPLVAQNLSGAHCTLQVTQYTCSGAHCRMCGEVIGNRLG